MSDQYFANDQLSKSLNNFFTEFELERNESDISLFDYLKKKEILFKPKDVPKESKEKIEELRVDNRSPILIIAIAIGSGVAVIATGFLLAFLFPDSEIVSILGSALIIGGIYLVYTGFRNAITNVIIFNDRLLFRKPFRRQKIFWRDVVRVKLYWKERTKREKNFWGIYRDVATYTVGIVMEFSLKGSKTKKLDLETYGVYSGGPIVTRIFQYMLFYKPNIFIPADFVEMLKLPKYQLPGMSRHKLINHNVKQSYQLLSSDPGKALEIAFGVLILDDKNPDGWKLVAILLGEIFPVEAFPFFDKAFKHFPNDPELSFAKALTFEKLENNEKAIDLYLNTLKRNPGHMQAITNYKRLTGEDPPTSAKIKYDFEPIKSRSVSITKDEISVLEDLMSYEKKILISDLTTWSSWAEEKVIKIATVHLGFIVEEEFLVKDVGESKRRLNVTRIRGIIGDKKEVDIEYIETLTKLPQEEIIAIVKIDLGFSFTRGKIKQKKKK